jgi:hypothetical protein
VIVLAELTYVDYMALYVLALIAAWLRWGVPARVLMRQARKRWRRMTHAEDSQ